MLKLHLFFGAQLVLCHWIYRGFIDFNIPFKDFYTILFCFAFCLLALLFESASDSRLRATWCFDYEESKPRLGSDAHICWGCILLFGVLLCKSIQFTEAS